VLWELPDSAVPGMKEGALTKVPSVCRVDSVVSVSGYLEVRLVGRRRRVEIDQFLEQLRRFK